MGWQTPWPYLILQSHYKNKFTEGQQPDSSGVIVKYSTEKYLELVKKSKNLIF